MSDIIRSYGIANLLDEYHHGSRQWLYKEVDEWLQRSQGGEGGSDASRLFLLLADAVGYAGTQYAMSQGRVMNSHRWCVEQPDLPSPAGGLRRLCTARVEQQSQERGPFRRLGESSAERVLCVWVCLGRLLECRYDAAALMALLTGSNKSAQLSPATSVAICLTRVARCFHDAGRAWARACSAA